MTTVSIRVNGETRSADVEDRTLLVQFLRGDCELTGTHVGCDTSRCGACVVHVDGKAVKSCQMPASFVEGEVTPIEGLGTPEALHAGQEAWIKHQVAQCGYCQSGQIMAAASFLTENPNPDDAAIDDAMSSNLCRCGTYPRIRAAVKTAARKLGDA